MKDELITFKTAKLAKEKGFDELCLCCYAYSPQYSYSRNEKCLESAINMTGNLYFDSDDMVNAEKNGYTTWLAPTQSLLQRWLREAHSIHINIWYEKSGKFTGNLNDDCANVIGIALFGEQWNTYEEALEAGLVEALKLIE